MVKPLLVPEARPLGHMVGCEKLHHFLCPYQKAKRYGLWGIPRTDGPELIFRVPNQNQIKILTSYDMSHSLNSVRVFFFLLRVLFCSVCFFCFFVLRVLCFSLENDATHAKHAQACFLCSAFFVGFFEKKPRLS